MKLLIGIFTSIVVLSLVACTSSDSSDGGSDDGNSGDTSLSQNACSSLGLGSRIITGTECSENNSPVVEVSLTLPDGRAGTCSGTMITSQVVLTAAHCFFENPSSVIVSASGVSVAGVSVIVHPDVRVDEAALSVFNDVALIRLANPVTLPTLPLVGSLAPVAGNTIQIFGYGQTEDESSSTNTVGTLRSGEMRISEVSTNFVQALYTGAGSNTCAGDSGGPALLKVNGSIGIIGVLSSGSLVDCEAGDISQFSNVQGTSIFNFITQNVSGVGVL